MNTVLVQEMERYNTYGPEGHTMHHRLYELIPLSLPQAVQHDPREPAESVEGHQGFGGDGRGAGGRRRRVDSGEGSREMGQVLLPEPQASGQLRYGHPLKAQVSAGERD